MVTGKANEAGEEGEVAMDEEGEEQEADEAGEAGEVDEVGGAAEEFEHGEAGEALNWYTQAPTRNPVHVAVRIMALIVMEMSITRWIGYKMSGGKEMTWSIWCGGSLETGTRHQRGPTIATWVLHARASSLNTRKTPNEYTAILKFMFLGFSIL